MNNTDNTNSNQKVLVIKRRFTPQPTVEEIKNRAAQNKEPEHKESEDAETK